MLNDGVLIRAWGPQHELDRLVNLLSREAPALARIDHIKRKPVHESCPVDNFKIVESENYSVQTGVIPDAATCPDCLEESLNPFALKNEGVFNLVLPENSPLKIEEKVFLGTVLL